jgi:hypothetical protein
MTSFNNTQKAGLFAAGAALITLLVLHNPFSGYRTSDGYQTASVPLPPTAHPPSKSPTEATTKEEFDQLYNEMNDWSRATEAARGKWEELPRPVGNWQSNDAMVDQVSTLGRVLTLAGGIIVVGALWFFIFRTKIEKND